MTALPVDPPQREDPLDPERILRALPDRERETFLVEYRRAVDGAHDRAGWPELRRFLRLWAMRAVAVAEPGYYEARERARAGTGGGMLLEDALREDRPGVIGSVLRIYCRTGKFVYWPPAVGCLQPAAQAASGPPRPPGQRDDHGHGRIRRGANQSRHQQSWSAMIERGLDQRTSPHRQGAGQTSAARRNPPLAVTLVLSGGMLTRAHGCISGEIHLQLAVRKICLPAANGKTAPYSVTAHEAPGNTPSGACPGLGELSRTVRPAGSHGPPQGGN